MQLEKDFRSNRSQNLFKTVCNLGKKSRKKHRVMKGKTISDYSDK